MPKALIWQRGKAPGDCRQPRLQWNCIYTLTWTGGRKAEGNGFALYRLAILCNFWLWSVHPSYFAVRALKWDPQRILGINLLFPAKEWIFKTNIVLLLSSPCTLHFSPLDPHVHINAKGKSCPSYIILILWSQVNQTAEHSAAWILLQNTESRRADKENPIAWRLWHFSQWSRITSVQWLFHISDPVEIFCRKRLILKPT